MNECMKKYMKNENGKYMDVSNSKITFHKLILTTIRITSRTLGKEY